MLKKALKAAAAAVQEKQHLLRCFTKKQRQRRLFFYPFPGKTDCVTFRSCLPPPLHIKQRPNRRRPSFRGGGGGGGLRRRLPVNHRPLKEQRAGEQEKQSSAFCFSPSSAADRRRIHCRFLTRARNSNFSWATAAAAAKKMRIRMRRRRRRRRSRGE